MTGELFRSPKGVVAYPRPSCNSAGPSVFVEETNLASLVAEIRRALRDSAATPRFVRTIHGFGYRFVGEVIVSTSDITDGVKKLGGQPQQLQFGYSWPFCGAFRDFTSGAADR